MIFQLRRGFVGLVTRRRGRRTASVAATIRGRAGGFEPLERRTLMAAVFAEAETTPVPHSGDAADDPAIWVHPTDVSLSTIIGSDKDGGLGVYDLSGQQIAYHSDGNMNNVDLRYNFPLGGQSVALVAASNRSNNTIALYAVDTATRTLRNVAARSITVGVGEGYGLAMYHSPVSGKYYAFVSDRDDGSVEQWELFDNGAGRVDAGSVRRFDAGGTVEGMMADDETGRLYAAEEAGGVWDYGAEPGDGTARTQIDHIDGPNLTPDTEGIGIYDTGNGTGYLVVSAQGSNDFNVYERESSHRFLGKFNVASGAIDGVTDCDGLEVTSFGLGPAWPEGLLAVQDYSNGTSNQNFKLVDWGDVARSYEPDLAIVTTEDPRGGGTVVEPPAAPSGLSATVVSSRRVDLSWSENSDNESGFQIERSAGGGVFAVVANAGPGVTTFTDSTVAAQTNYSYRVAAFNPGGSSAPSNVATATTPAAEPVTTDELVAAGSTWRFLDNGSDQGSAWSAPTFGDAAWRSGPAQLGYGEGDEATPVNSGGTTKFITTYFRREFDVADASAVFDLNMRLLRDDGAVVYLNGIEVARSNMPSGAVDYATRAASGISDTAEGTWHTIALDPAALATGQNLIAVEVHQNSENSTDVSFDMSLTATRIGQAPTAPPAAPSGLLAAAGSPTRINLSWTDNSDNESGFRIERSAAGGAWSALAGVGAGVTAYADTSASPETAYAYRVVAVNAAGPSAASNVATATTPARPQSVELIAAGSTWRFLDNGSNQGTAWQAAAFNDTTWKSGPAQLGYGDGDEATPVNSGGSTKYITTYFRREFDVVDSAAVNALELKLIRDDGAVVYLNGVELIRSNMPSGTIGYTTRASSTVDNAGAATWHTIALDPARLVTGRNVITVELHQSSSTSTDVSFDLALTASQSGQQTIAPAAPSALSATAASPTRVELSWTDNSSNESGFRLERSADGSTWSTLATTGPGVTAYVDHSAAPSTTYRYRVVAFNSAGDSASSPTASATTPAGDTTSYTGPIVITSGGTYSGNWESLDPDVAAVTIRTTEPVVIEGANVRGRGVLIETAVDGADVTVRDTRGYGMNPDVYGLSPGRFFEADRFDSVVLENNYLQGTGGIKLLEYAGDFTASDSVRVVGNYALNIDGRKSDGAGGFLDFNERTRRSDGFHEDGYKIRQFIQLDKVQGVPGMEIAWNRVVNEPGRSRVEDNINIYKSGGTASSPIRIHDNYIQGAYTVRPWQGGTTTDGTWDYDWGYAGGGILLGDGSSGVAHVEAYGNTVVSTTNYGIATAAGHDTRFHHNRVVSSGRLADGRFIAEQNVGVYIWDLYATGSGFYNNSADNNQVGWVNGTDGSRNDWWIPNASSFEDNTHWPGMISTQTEANEFTLWQDRAAAAGQLVGPTA